MGNLLKAVVGGIVVGAAMQIAYDLARYGAWRAEHQIKENNNG